MILLVYVVLIAIPVTFGCMVLARIRTTSESRAKILSLCLSFALLVSIAYLMLPGPFTSEKDLSNSILLYLWFIQSVCFWLVSAASTLFLETPAEWIVDRINSNDPNSLRDTFE